MNRKQRAAVILLAVLLVIIALAPGCLKQESSAPNPAEFKSGTLTIRGKGVEKTLEYQAEELKSIEEARASESYSTVNNVGTKSFFRGEGIKLSYLLQAAGIRESAQSILIMGADGYTAVFTREQLEEPRFCFPGLAEGSEEEAREVPVLLSWKTQEGSKDFDLAARGSLCLLLGQTGLNNVVVPAFVKDVVLIDVSTEQPGQWDAIIAIPDPGQIKAGTDIVLSHPDMDAVKIYYTTDGSVPNEKSSIYNPSTSYFKPEMNQPIAIDQDTVIKAVAIGFGRNNSPIAVFEYYDVQD
jgi:hypothetical protein